MVTDDFFCIPILHREQRLNFENHMRHRDSWMLLERLIGKIKKHPEEDKKEEEKNEIQLV
jgi:hypothetical protein